ncbi:TspO/MBR family protein [Lactococcus lactis]|uniref:TspO/MBR family protein n=1 Tax=Lactococcus lactis TaxID=1358 RepID=UPI003D1532CF
MTSKKLKALGQLILFIVGIELIGGLAGLLAGDIKGIYNNLKLPPLAPPDYLFGIVWPVLYALIAISAYLIFYKLKTQRSEGQNALFYFGIQLILNFIWSIIFFKGYFWLGVIIILLLDFIVYLCIIKFSKINKWSAFLLIPYFIWIIFATYLSISVAILN